MVIRNNLIGSNLIRNWQQHNNRIGTAIERLSTGMKINRSADDPSGMCISERMRMQLQMLKTDQDNVADAISQTNITDGQLSETQEMLQRMAELAAKASSGTISDPDREALDSEFQQLLDEIDRANQPSPFYLVRSLPEQKGAEAEGEAISISGNNLEAYLDALDQYLSDVSSAAKAGDSSSLLELGIDTSSGLSDKELLHAGVLEFTKKKGEALFQSGDVTSSSEYTLWISSGGSIRVDLKGVNSKSLGLEGVHIRDQESAADAIDRVKHAIDLASRQRGETGALQNRLEHVMNSLAKMEENLTAAYSNITNADMAKEMTELAREQILAQASSFLMAQANQQPNEVITLLKSM